MGGKRRAPKPPAGTKAAWDRDQFSVRLTDLRRSCLRLISDAMPDGSTPNDAFDRALEIALSKAPSEAGPAVDVAARLDDLEELVARMGREREAEAASQRAISTENLRETKSVAALISAVAAMPPSSAADGADDEDEPWEGGDGAIPAAVPSLREWLDVRAGSAQSLACVARWRSKTRLGDRLVAMEFDIEMQGHSGGRAVVRIEPLDTASPLAFADQGGALSLVCHRIQSRGWDVSVCRLNPDRSVGLAIAQIRV
jgi:hypothetical protein